MRDKGKSWIAVLLAAALASLVVVPTLAAAQAASAFVDGAELWIASDCAGDVPIVVGSDAAAQSDIYSAVTLAGVVGTDCVILAGPRDGQMPAAQQSRLNAATAGGYIVGGTAAVPGTKTAGRDMKRLAGTDRWATARLVGTEARTISGGTTPSTPSLDTSLTAPDDVSRPGVHLSGAEPWIASDCAGDVPIVVGSDADAQSDIYSAVTLAGVVGTDCVILAGPRDGNIPPSQQARLDAAASGGYVVGGTAAVPTAKITGRDMTRLAGTNRWATAQLVGRHASGDTTAGTSTSDEAPVPAAGFSAVSAGNGYASHTCGVRTDGRVACWGYNRHGEADAPDGTFLSVSVGDNFSCGIRTSNRIACWGWNRDGRTDSPLGEFLSVSAGRAHACGLRTDGRVACWGRESDVPVSAPTGTFTAVSAISGGACGIRTGGQIECWGGTRYEDSPPWEGNQQYTTISSNGSGTTCALRRSEQLECWFFDNSGDWSLPHQPSGAFTSVSTGDHQRCGLRTTGQIECWHFARLEVTDAPQGKFSAVSVGREHTCGVRADGQIECWGDNEYGQAASPGPSGPFTAVSGSGTPYFDAGAPGLTCGVRSGGQVECWGGFGQERAQTPLAAAFTTVSVGRGDFIGRAHACGVRIDGQVECWGNRSFGATDAPAGTFTAVSAGHRHSCGVRSDGHIKCWGSNRFGESDAPDGTFRTVSAFSKHVCGVRTNGMVSCWGDNEHGQTDAPKGTFTTVSVGHWHSCGIRTDGTVTCWGARGDFGRTDAPAGTFTTVAAGQSHSCAVRTTGTVACWGSNYTGALDAPEGTFTTVAAGIYDSCGVRTDGQIECWGSFPNRVV